MKTIKKEWEEYRHDVIPADEPEENLINLERTFYFSAFMVMERFKNWSNLDMSESMKIALVNNRYRELCEYLENI